MLEASASAAAAATAAAAVLLNNRVEAGKHSNSQLLLLDFDSRACQTRSVGQLLFYSEKRLTAKKKLVKVSFCAAFQVTATPSLFAQTLISSLFVAVMREPLASQKKNAASRQELRGGERGPEIQVEPAARWRRTSGRSLCPSASPAAPAERGMLGN